MRSRVRISDRDKEMKRLYVEERLTYNEIAQMYGITRQRVCQILGRFGPEHVRMLGEEQCVYPALRKWMNDNHMSKNELCRRMYGKYNSQFMTFLNNFLKGKSREISKTKIDQFLKVTGLTYEEFFSNEDVKTWEFKRVEDAPVFFKNRYYCPYCGHYQTEGYQRHCSYCGKRVYEPELTTEEGENENV